MCVRKENISAFFSFLIFAPHYMRALFVQTTLVSINSTQLFQLGKHFSSVAVRCVFCLFIRSESHVSCCARRCLFKHFTFPLLHIALWKNEQFFVRSSSTTFAICAIAAYVFMHSLEHLPFFFRIRFSSLSLALQSERAGRTFDIWVISYWFDYTNISQNVIYSNINVSSSSWRKNHM